MAQQNKKTERNWIGGSGKEFIFPDNGQIINCFISIDDLMSLPRTEKGYVRFVVAERKDPDQFKNTHYFYEDNFTPDKSKAKGGTAKNETAPETPEIDTEENDTDDLPF
jgi:hypothetical protein